MRLTTRRRYAVIAMMDLAMHQDSGAISLKEISLRQSISQSYLEQLFAKLRRNGLVKSIRGPGGGYIIPKDLRTIKVIDIIDAIEEQSMKRDDCSSLCECRGNEYCLTRNLWSNLSRVMYEYLSGISLAQLVEENRELQKA